MRNSRRLYSPPRPISAFGPPLIQPPQPGRVESSRVASSRVEIALSRARAQGFEVSNPRPGTQHCIGLYPSLTGHGLRPHDVIITRTATQAQRRKWDHRSISTRATLYRLPHTPAIATPPATPVLCLSICFSASPQGLHKESSSHRRDFFARGVRALSCGSCSPAQTRQAGSA